MDRLLEEQKENLQTTICFESAATDCQIKDINSELKILNSRKAVATNILLPGELIAGLGASALIGYKFTSIDTPSKIYCALSLGILILTIRSLYKYISELQRVITDYENTKGLLRYKKQCLSEIIDEDMLRYYNSIEIEILKKKYEEIRDNYSQDIINAIREAGRVK